MIKGSILLGSTEARGGDVFHATDPATGERLEPAFAAAGESEVARACLLANEASTGFAETAPEVRAEFLEAVAEQIAALDDALIVRAMRETGLPRARLEGERGRTVGQLRMFASVVRQGDFIDATIDPALPDRAPLPRPDLRRRNLALGPVAVFGASNFPLAFSVAGGDTASAFAAGCPVVAKGHPAHPGAGELVARAIRAAVEQCGLHEGVFSFLPGMSNALGAALVSDPRIKAVGFTGSRQGGLALAAIAAARAEPIPVFAEMSSINPVLLMPTALEARASALAEGFAQSLTMGAGQFCTNPGLVLAADGLALEKFLATAADALAASSPQTMLTAAIRNAYDEGAAALSAHSSVRTLARGPEGGGPCEGQAALFSVDAQSFLADNALQREVFGSSSLVVRCRDAAEMGEVVASLEGQLTVTVHFDKADEPLVAELMPVLERKAGRVLGNGWPTGVEVSHAMVHGGPYPATTDGRTTSVGALAIARFLRPVCYQNLPDPLLPEALRDENPFHLARRIDGAVQPAPRRAS